jgi:hypothetical protein
MAAMLKITQAKLDKLQRLADPARNPNEHERAVASRKLAEFKARQSGRPSRKPSSDRNRDRHSAGYMREYMRDYMRRRRGMKMDAETGSLSGCTVSGRRTGAPQGQMAKKPGRCGPCRASGREGAFLALVCIRP